MILYLDTSALVKRYIAETGSPQMALAISQADMVGSSAVAQVETTAALSKAIRTQTLSSEEASVAIEIFRNDWPNLIRLQTTEAVIDRAATLAWEIGLRGYDAVHLASAMIWQEGMGETILFATFDKQLWQAASEKSLRPFPPAL